MFRALSLFILLFGFNAAKAQTPQDTVYLMNGHIVGAKVIDTLLGAVTIFNPKKPSEKLNYEWDQLYMVKFATGEKRYYYYQDSLINNWFSRDEMWMYMKGENDARKYYKGRGALIGSAV